MAIALVKIEHGWNDGEMVPGRAGTQKQTVENELIFAMRKNIASGKYSIKRTAFYINSCNPGTIDIHHRVTIKISI
jgi:hypothetical protein